MNKPKNHYALSFVSADSEGLVAEASKVLFNNGFNIADSSSVLLRGVFSMIFIVTNEKKYSKTDIENMFALSKIKPHVFEYQGERTEDLGEKYSVSVYGADKSGIVHKTSAAMAENGVNITDLQTKITGKPGSEVYIMVFEVSVPENAGDRWKEELKKAASKTGTEVSVKKIEYYEL